MEGLGVVCLLATILPYAMMLRYSFDLGDEDDLVENAVEGLLGKGLRTADIMQDGKELVSTTDMGQAVIDEMAALSG